MISKKISLKNTREYIYENFKFQTAIIYLLFKRKDYMKLNHKESVIIRLRFGISTEDPMTYVEIAEVVGISKTMVKVLEQKALRKLKHISNRNKMLDLKDTLDLINSPIN